MTRAASWRRAAAVMTPLSLMPLLQLRFASSILLRPETSPFPATHRTSTRLPEFVCTGGDCPFIYRFRGNGPCVRVAGDGFRRVDFQCSTCHVCAPDSQSRIEYSFGIAHGDSPGARIPYSSKKECAVEYAGRASLGCQILAVPKNNRTVECARRAGYRQLRPEMVYRYRG